MRAPRGCIARAIDRREYGVAHQIFTEDATLIGPGFEVHGPAKIERGFRVIERYESTFHAVHNQLVETDRDAATGETYCVASHVYARDGERRKLDWDIRYQDRFRRVDGEWRFTRREFVVDWEQDLPLDG